MKNMSKVEVRRAGAGTCVSVPCGRGGVSWGGGGSTAIRMPSNNSSNASAGTIFAHLFVTLSFSTGVLLLVLPQCVITSAV